jgi:hypothetical protein
VKTGSRIATLILFFAPAVASGQVKQIVLDSDEYHYTATFDPRRISEDRLRELLAFSPYDLSPVAIVAHQEIDLVFEQKPGRLYKAAYPLVLEMCISGDRNYQPCGSRGISDPNFFSNAEINLNRNESAMAALDGLDVPVELLRIVGEYRRSLHFYSTLQQKRMAYLREGNVDELAQSVEGIDPSVTCAAEIAALKAADTPEQGYYLSNYHWYNCLSSAWSRKSPAYPIGDWQLFLKDYGIREEFMNRAID